MSIPQTSTPPHPWGQRARAAIATLAASGEPFTSTDVILAAGPPPPGPLTGSLIAAEHRSGRIRLAGTQLDTNAAGRPVATRVWIGASAGAER